MKRDIRKCHKIDHLDLNNAMNEFIGLYSLPSLMKITMVSHFLESRKGRQGMKEVGWLFG